MSGFFSIPMESKMVLPWIIGGCILVSNVITAWLQITTRIVRTKLVGRRPSVLRHDTALVEEEDDPLSYIIMVGIRMDVGLTMDELPDYWGLAFCSIYKSCVETKQRLLSSWWRSGCDKFGVQVRDEAHLLQLAMQCRERNINYVILREENVTGIDMTEPRLNGIVMGPCRTRDFERFTRDLPSIE